MKLVGKDLGGRRVIKKGVLSQIDWSVLYSFCEEQAEKERAEHYRPGKDPITGEDGFINRNGYFFPASSVDEMPMHLAHVQRDKRPEIKKIFDYCEKVRDRLLWEDYLHKFPIAGKCIWWKIKGHVLRYPVGAYIGSHADVSTDYEYGKPHPTDQIATRTTVSTLGFFNNRVETEGELNGTNFMGGLLKFEYIDVEYSPERGDLLIFPANYMGAHGTTPVTAGIRYSHVGWYCHGSPNPKYREDVLDPNLEPDRVDGATNIYMTEKYNILPSSPAGWDS